MTSIHPTPRRSGDHAHPLPPSVVERCATTGGFYGSAHGATACGVNELAAENVLEPLRALAEDMRLAYVRWLAEQEGVPYPVPGSEIPDQPAYVVGNCGHRVARSEWRAGWRTCERCPNDVDEAAEQRQAATR